jgi:hypothetical protein
VRGSLYHLQMPSLDELRAERRRLMHSMEYAYAMGATRTMGARDPRLEWVVERVDELSRQIAALKREHEE